jgi:hypothetical protein
MSKVTSAMSYSYRPPTAPDVRGNQFQRFGPINGPNGHRRLNVLFTRAKKRTVEFSSLDPDRLQTTANSPWGLRALKPYLAFARSGILRQPDQGTEQATDDFERAVGAVLRTLPFCRLTETSASSIICSLFAGRADFQSFPVR